MEDPVRTKYGHVFEREALDNWILKCGPENACCPVTRQPLCATDVESAPDITTAILEWIFSQEQEKALALEREIEELQKETEALEQEAEAREQETKAFEQEAEALEQAALEQEAEALEQEALEQEVKAQEHLDAVALVRRNRNARNRQKRATAKANKANNKARAKTKEEYRQMKRGTRKNDKF
jgi:TolA-binding protein